MSNSPKVDFIFENNNVVQSTPLRGVSFVYAATSKGPVNDASTLITSVSQFRELFGEELIKGQPVSVIEKALLGGSKLRICRVKGTGSTPGTCTAKLTFTGIAEVSFILKYPYDSLGTTPRVSFETAPNGRVFLTLSNSEKTLESLYLYAISGSSSTSASYDEDDVMPVADNSKFQWDIDGLMKFEGFSSYLKVQVKDLTNKGLVTDLVKLNDYLGTVKSFAITKVDGTITNGTYTIPSSDTDYNEEVLDVLADYQEVYQVTFSGINQFIGAENAYKVHQKWAEIYVPLQEYTLYVEVPYSTTNSQGVETIMTHTEMINWVSTHINQVGNSKYIIYFGGGCKYYDGDGNLRNANCMGGILGLGDTCATNFGPWRSFAGKNRGLLPDVVGPVVSNYGSPSRYSQLNELAQNYINMIVIKDTENMGKQSMLWHLFTSQFKQDSERFLAIVRLNLYLKKTLRPIVEDYIEEPNIWTTWKNMYFRIKPILDDLVTNDAMSEYDWMGDQFAQSYKDLTVNNEADVRQGKYKAYLRYKDIVTLQEVIITITIDQAERSVTVIPE